jgi:hypothetical protein
MLRVVQALAILSDFAVLSQLTEVGKVRLGVQHPHGEFGTPPTVMAFGGKSP